MITESRALDRGMKDRDVVKVTGPGEFPASESLLLLLGPLDPSWSQGPSAQELMDSDL